MKFEEKIKRKGGGARNHEIRVTVWRNSLVPKKPRKNMHYN